jgi:hypothetical protein
MNAKLMREKNEARLQDLRDRAHWITEGYRDFWESNDDYVERFGRALVNGKDLTEEYAFLCSELGWENILDT